MFRSLATAGVFLLTSSLMLGACVSATPPVATQSASVSVTTTPGAPTASQPVVATPAMTSGTADDQTQPLMPDTEAAYTTGDTARVSGGDFVGDQADLTVIQATVGPGPDASTSSYAFLVDITGLDAETFPYNLRDFRLIDDQNFQYEPLFEGGEQPRLEFGDLSPNQTVRGWLTFEGPAAATTVQLQYSPALALEPAIFGFNVPGAAP